MLAAQVVVVLHLAYLVYVVLGGFLGLRSLIWLWPHMITVAWGVFGLFASVECPLTDLEKWLLTLGGVEPYDGPFIDHYLTGVVYPTAWEDLVMSLGAVVVLTSYVVVLARRSRHDGHAVVH